MVVDVSKIEFTYEISLYAVKLMKKCIICMAEIYKHFTHH